MIKLNNDISYYNGSPTESQEELAETIFDFLNHIDIILGIKNMLKLHIKNVMENGI
jgi:hypothetical protein